MHARDQRSQLEERWEQLQRLLRDRLGASAGLEGVLFLIGLHSRGMGYEPQMSKEQKQELIVAGGYEALSRVGVFAPVSDEEGPSAWRRVSNPAPMKVDEQEDLLREGAVRYFEDQGLLVSPSGDVEPLSSNERVSRSS